MRLLTFIFENKIYMNVMAYQLKDISLHCFISFFCIHKSFERKSWKILFYIVTGSFQLRQMATHTVLVTKWSADGSAGQMARHRQIDQRSLVPVHNLTLNEEEIWVTAEPTDFPLRVSAVQFSLMRKTKLRILTISNSMF